MPACDHSAVLASDARWYALRFVATTADDLDVRACPECGQELSRPHPDVSAELGHHGIGTPRGLRLSPRSHRPFEARSRRATEKLPPDWRPAVVVPRPTGSPEPTPSKAMRTEGRMATEVLPVVGRAGSKEWARNAAPCFGGSESR